MSKQYKPFIEVLNFKNNIIDDDFDVISSQYENQPSFNLGYHYYTKQVREKMNSTDLKKRNFYLIVNEFENQVPEYDDSLDSLVSKKLKFSKGEEIISRDFYKLWELITYFDLISDKSIKTVSVSENGGFLQCISYFRNTFFKSNSDTYSYLSSNNKVSSNTIKNIKDTTFNKINGGPIEILDDESELANVDNIEKFIKSNKISSNIDLITANGTVQFNENSNTEHQMYKLMLGHIILAISITKNGGDFILRTDDFFTDVTLKLINILGNCYKKIYVTKPLFSRNFLNEKYIVCKNFNLQDSKKDKLIKKLKNLLNEINRIDYYVHDIIQEYKINDDDKNVIAKININLVGDEHLNINKIIDYKNKKNYFGEQYHKFRNNQIDANKWWNDTFLKNKLSDLNNVKNVLVK